MRILIAALALLATPVHAACTGSSLYQSLPQSELDRIETAAAAIPYAEGLFWSATRGDEQIRLIGTIHIHDPRLGPFEPLIAEALTGADRLLVEITLEDTAKLEASIVTDPQVIMLPPGPGLPDMLDEALWNDLTAAAEARGLPAFMLGRMQPWYLSLILSVPPCAFTELMSGEKGLDFTIMDMAEARGIPQQSLEAWNTLFTIFSADPIERQIELLSLGILPPDTQSAAFVATLDDYFAGRVGALWEMSRSVARNHIDLTEAEADALFLEFEEALLINRNLAWIPVIETALEADDVLVVAVGAAHLPGEQGVLRLLQDRGWVIAQLPMP